MCPISQITFLVMSSIINLNKRGEVFENILFLGGNTSC